MYLVYPGILLSQRTQYFRAQYVIVKVQFEAGVSACFEFGLLSHAGSRFSLVPTLRGRLSPDSRQFVVQHQTAEAVKSPFKTLEPFWLLFWGGVTELLLSAPQFFAQLPFNLVPPAGFHKVMRFLPGTYGTRSAGS